MVFMYLHVFYQTKPQKYLVHTPFREIFNKMGAILAKKWLPRQQWMSQNTPVKKTCMDQMFPFWPQLLWTPTWPNFRFPGQFLLWIEFWYSVKSTNFVLKSSFILTQRVFWTLYPYRLNDVGVGGKIRENYLPRNIQNSRIHEN